MHGARLTRQYRCMKRKGERPRHVAARDAEGRRWGVSIPQPASPPSTPSPAAASASESHRSRLSRQIPLNPAQSRLSQRIPLSPTESRLSRRIPLCPTESRLSRQIPLIPPNPAHPAASHLSRRIPLVPANPAYPGESHLSHSIPLHLAESRQSSVNPIPRDPQGATWTATAARDAVVSHSRSFYPSTRRPHHVMAALDAAIHVFAQGSVGPAERDARIESGHDECWRGSVGETAHRPDRMRTLETRH